MLVGEGLRLSTDIRKWAACIPVDKYEMYGPYCRKPPVVLALAIHPKVAAAVPTEWLKAGSPDPFAKERLAVNGAANALTAIIAELWRAASAESNGPSHFKPS